MQDFDGIPLLTLVESYAKGERIKKAQVFSKDEIFEFLKNAPTKNRYYLVRKVVTLLAYMGGNRLGEIRKLTFDSLKRCENGFTVSFEHLKQRAQLQTSQ